MATLRDDLPPLPLRLASLPIDPRGYPIPWFVGVLPDGSRDIRFADGKKRIIAVANRLCWVCGQPLGRFMSFVLGPMCSINRVSAEPPAHLECALFSVRACPFLTKPQMTRRENDLPENRAHSGVMLLRNPGVMAVWTTRDYSPFSDGDGGFLLRLGEPTSVTWWREGRTASRAEVLESIESGFPALLELAAPEGPDALDALHQMRADALVHLPPEQHETL